MGLSFFVNEHVLIPRQDTETLVELVPQEQKDKDISILDMYWIRLYCGEPEEAWRICACGRRGYLGKALKVAKKMRQRSLKERSGNAADSSV